ncbi:MAG: Gfo/Idh/MocA family oxidoreductase [Acidimicrobiia bacterium]
MTVQRIRIGIVGAGANTVRTHIPNLQRLDGVEIVSVVNRSRSSSQRVADEWSIPRVADDWGSLVNDDDIDAVVIGTWPNLHHPVTMAALQAGKHVLCEARMAMNAREAREMHDAARTRPQLVAQVVPAPISLAVDATVTRLISEGHLGRVLSVEVEARSGASVDPSAPLHWRQDADRSGMNIMSLGIWYETAMRWVGEAGEVMAMGTVTVPWRADETGRMRAVKVPDHIDVVARMACGAQARFHVSEATGPPAVNRITVRGADGVLAFENGTLLGAKANESQLQPILIPESETGRWRVEEEFVNAIRGLERVSLTDFGTGVKYMEFTEAVARSMTQHRAVALPLSLDD